MSSSILVNGNQRSELVIFVSKEKRHGSIMASVPANKENVSPEKDIECLSDSFEKNLSMISSHKENDGRYFLDLVEKETERFTRLCHIAEQEMTANTIPEDGKSILGDEWLQICTVNKTYFARRRDNSSAQLL